AKHGFETETQEEYAHRCLDRFANPHLPDPVERVGRAVLRKLSRHERIIAPAAELADRGMSHDALLDAFSAALAFSPAGDEAVDRLQELLRTHPAHVVATAATRLTPADPPLASGPKRSPTQHP